MNQGLHWVRTCQECGLKQITPPPSDPQDLPVSFTDRKCTRCKSPGLDYGSWKEKADG